jgi:hypothetical protein
MESDMSGPSSDTFPHPAETRPRAARSKRARRIAMIALVTASLAGAAQAAAQPAPAHADPISVHHFSGT